ISLPRTVGPPSGPGEAPALVMARNRHSLAALAGAGQGLPTLRRMLTGVPLFLLQLVVILASAVLLGRLASRFGQPAIVGELAAGILLGPSVLGKLAPECAEWLPRPGSGALID